MSSVEITLAGGQEDPFPVVSQLWELFMEKGTQTLFVSIGSSSTAAPELDILEMLGCKLLMIEPNSKKRELWQAVKDTLTKRSATDDMDPFVRPASKKWVLAKNIFVEEGIVSAIEGTTSYEGEACKLVRLNRFVGDFIKTGNLQVSEPRIDICKIDMPGFERSIVSDLLDEGFRPALLLVRWAALPDADMQTTQIAGHLQNCGYQLVAKHEDKFTYFYNDKNMYDICSWEQTNVENPLTDTIMRSCVKQLARQEKKEASS